MKTPVNTAEQTPTAASLMPCYNGWQDDWIFDKCDASGACRVSQNGTCLGAYGCDSSRLMMFDCADTHTPLSCQMFKLSKAGALIHEASKLCAAEVVELGAGSKAGEQEHIAQLAPCVGGNSGQAWRKGASGQLMVAGSCLSTKMRRASLQPTYASICARFYYNWFSSASAQRALCLEAYLLRGRSTHPKSSN